MLEAFMLKTDRDCGIFQTLIFIKEFFIPVEHMYHSMQGLPVVAHTVAE